jgi:probable rRNA maturation factor
VIGRAGPPRARGVQVTLTDDCDEDVDGPRWARLLAAVLEAEGVAPGAEAGLTFVSPSAMAELNQAHMGGDGPTDVLAFPIDGLDAEGGASPGVVGDVVICPVVAWAGAEGHAGSDDDELALLVVHGALHLLGHDHAEAAERSVMQGRERALLAAHHGALAGDPWGAG